jgi:hypothetical protein
MEPIATITISVMILVILLLLFVTFRNLKVLPFRIKLIQICHDCGEANGFNGISVIYQKIPKYTKMVYSIKPLKVRYWVSKEHYKLLQPYV